MSLHSDRGSQFTSQLFRKTLRCYKIVQSMSNTGGCYDNAHMERFFATLKKEKLYHMDTTKLRRISLVNGGLPPLMYRKNDGSSFPPTVA